MIQAGRDLQLLCIDLKHLHLEFTAVTDSVGSALEQGAQLHPQFLALHPQFRMMQQRKTVQILCCVNRNA